MLGVHIVARGTSLGRVLPGATETGRCEGNCFRCHNTNVLIDDVSGNRSDLTGTGLILTPSRMSVRVTRIVMWWIYQSLYC